MAQVDEPRNPGAAPGIGGGRVRGRPIVLLVTNIPTPYRIPLFNELARQLECAGYALKVAFSATGYARRKWEIDLGECRFEYAILHGRKLRLGSAENVVFGFPGLGRLIDCERPVVVVTSGFSPATTELWFRNLVRRTPYVIWSGAIDSPGRPISRLRRWQRTLLVRRAAGFVAYGSRARDYLVSLGAEEKRIHIGINAVDIGFFSRQVDKWRARVEKEDRHELLTIGAIAQGKRLDLLLKAAAVLSRSRSDFGIRFVGEGPERDRLETLTAELGLGKHVRFEGYCQKGEIPRFLAAATCFLFPSNYDIWGLVLVEAMAAGVPCIASIHAGATHDLIREGQTGFAMDFADSASVAERIAWILDNPAEAAGIGRAGRSFVEENVTLEVSARGFVDAIRAAVSKKHDRK